MYIRYDCHTLGQLYGDPALGRNAAKTLRALARWRKARIIGKVQRAHTVVRAEFQRSAAQFHNRGASAAGRESTAFTWYAPLAALSRQLDCAVYA